jgi:hypothetical protein
MTNYGLKVNSKYDLNSYQEKIMTAGGDVVLFESGIYKIYCDGDIFIKHNITSSLMHIKCVSVRDDIKINIECVGKIVEEGSENKNENKNLTAVCDIYHEVLVKNKNVEVNINAKGVVSGDAKIIYRSKIINYENGMIGTGTGKQKAEFLKMSDESEVDAEPMLDIMGDGFKSSHSFSVTHINEEKRNYLALHGYENSEIEKEIVESFLNS